jgi:hypothetical protein
MIHHDHVDTGTLTSQTYVENYMARLSTQVIQNDGFMNEVLQAAKEKFNVKNEKSFAMTLVR